jgi:hypothetical protein
MSNATVFGASQYGLSADSTATGLLVGTISWDASSSQAQAPNHIGCDVAFAVYNQKKDVSVDGIVATKTTGLIGNMGAVITLANTTNNGRTRLSEGLGDTPVSNTALIVTGGSTSGTGTGFETGKLTCIYLPSISTNAPTTLT